MLKIKKPNVPIEAQGKINRLNSEAEMRTDMTVRDNINKGGYFILHDVLYQAIQALPKGTEARPGKNCVAKSLNELGGN